MSHPTHHDEADRSSIHISQWKRLDNALHHQPQCPYPRTSVFSKHTTRRLSQGIFLELEHSRGHGYQSRLFRRYISRKWTFGVFNVVRERLHKGIDRDQHTAPAFSRNERKEEETKHWDFPLIISLLSLSYISSFFLDHAQTNLLRVDQQ